MEIPAEREKQNMKNKNANNMMWVEHWIGRFDPQREVIDIWGYEQPNGKWKCEIELPLINKVVKSISKTQVGSMKNATDKASKVINEYIKEHPECAIKNKFKGKEYCFTEDEQGHVITVGLSEKAEQTYMRQTRYIAEESLKVMKTAVNRIKKINGSDDGVFIETIKLSDVGENATSQQINMRLWEHFQKTHNYQIQAINWLLLGESVIAIGYTFPNQQ